MIWDDFKSIVQGVTDFFNKENYIDNNDYGRIEDNPETIRAIFEAKNNKFKADIALEKEIASSNEGFSIGEFLINAGTVFTSLLTSRNTQLLEPIRNCITDDLFNILSEDYKILKSKGEVNIIKNISIEDSELLSYQTDEEKEFLTVRVKVKYMNYFLEEETGSFRRGNRYDNVMHFCKLIFIKNNDYDKLQDENEVTNCPNCGAPLEMGNFNECKYCNTVVQLPKKQWLLMNFEIKEIYDRYLYEKTE